MTNYEKIQSNLHKAQLGHLVIEGDTLYTFENHRRHDLKLPKKSYDGKDFIRPRGTFKGDAYFLMLVRSGDVRLIDSQPVNQQPVQTEVLKESVGGNMQKLILDQPDKVTAAGTSEAVVVENPTHACCKGTSGCKNTNEKTNSEGVLLTENPLDGIDIIKG